MTSEHLTGGFRVRLVGLHQHQVMPCPDDTLVLDRVVSGQSRSQRRTDQNTTGRTDSRTFECRQDAGGERPGNDQWTDTGNPEKGRADQDAEDPALPRTDPGTGLGHLTGRDKPLNLFGGLHVLRHDRHVLEQDARFTQRTHGRFRQVVGLENTADNLLHDSPVLRACTPPEPER